MIPTGGGPPGVVGQVPPDRVQMTPEDHQNALLDYYRSALTTGAMSPEDQMSLRAFMEGLNGVFEMAAGAGQQPTPSPGELNGEEVPYGQTDDAVSMMPRVGQY
jgi:hypothetical protein